jgi:hypothetical protein
MNVTKNVASSQPPILVELGAATWDDWLDKAESWFGNVLLTQTSFTRLLEDTIDKLHEPHIKRYLADMLEKEREHDHHAEALFRAIGRKPSTGRKLGATLVSKAREVLTDVQGRMGGAVGGWKDLRELLIASVDARGAFAIAEQIGLALGLPAIVDITFKVANEKTVHQLLLQEYVLELAPMAILYRAPLKAPVQARPSRSLRAGLRQPILSGRRARPT